MKLIKLALVLLIPSAFTACSGGGKKVLIMASGKITVDPNNQQKISLVPGTQHNEKEIVLSGKDATQIDVQTTDGSKSFDLEGSGSYVINLKPDTLVGGVVKYGASQNLSRIGLEQLDHIIDSTKQLMEGKNASDANRSYFLPPYSVKKISDNTEAKLIGPYNNIPGSVKVDKEGNGPETYKFFTNKQKRESLEEIIRQMKE
jgi:hypothetical protein